MVKGQKEKITGIRAPAVMKKRTAKWCVLLHVWMGLFWGGRT